MEIEKKILKDLLLLHGGTFRGKKERGLNKCYSRASSLNILIGLWAKNYCRFFYFS